ncbi:HAMP domain-containing sensor histidine kinase [Derxia lacustris]|uniref:HAMP domain-containing sensor histidine kinase n=1 Tax=Derxia lacustris TaxID=764842 RepID=UPI000A170073|nr:HAMP domain-containing sensor histidine kinase [Derxia lacustris]
MPREHRLARHLWLRIWLAVVATVLLFALLAGAAWRLYADEVRSEFFRHEHPGPPPWADRAPPGVAPEDWNDWWAERKREFEHRPPKPPPGMPHGPFGPLGLVGLLGVLAGGVAFGAYPVVRRLTRQLEDLHASVRRFGGGDLQARATVHGSDEVAGVARSFNDAAERIEGLVEAQRSLLANASHELRSPLARLRMASEMLGASASAGLRDEMRRNIGELDQLIEEILLASRLEAAREVPIGDFEPVDLAGLVAEEAAHAGVACDAVALQLSGDARLLRRLVRNLIENALRYAKPAAPASGADADFDDSPDAPLARPDIVVTLARSADAERARLTVCDRGPGVADADRERVFEAFYRVPGASEREGGVGLGLALVRKIARHHGGEARCLARDGGGACFEVLLPLA